MPGHDEFVRVDHDADPAAIGAQPEFQDGQAALGGDRDAHRVAQFEAAAGAEFLFGEEFLGEQFQPFLLVDRQDGEKGQAGDGLRPEVGGNLGAAPAAQPVEEAHYFLVVSQMPVKIRAMPR